MRIGIACAAALCWSTGLVHAEGLAAAQCNRAWLASDWPTVEIECTQAAENLHAEGKSYTEEAVAQSNTGAPEQLVRGGLQIAVFDFNAAGIYHAKEALGYYKLKMPGQYGAARDIAAQEFQLAIKGSQLLNMSPALSPALLDLVRSNEFPTQAQRSILLNPSP